MQTKTLNNINKTKTFKNCEVPTVGLGTYRLNGKTCFDAVTHALEIGYRHIDTAQHYGNEEEIGKAIAASDVSREEVFITTKIWYTNLNQRDLKKSFQGSLDKLQTDYVDLLLIHWPNTEEIPLTETLTAMEELKKQNKVRFIGVSNFTQELIAQAVDQTAIVANQIEYHPFLPQDKLLQTCQENDLFLIAYSPLARAEVTDNATISEIAKKHHKTPAQISLKWLIQQRNVIAIPRSASSEHREQNIDVFDFKLTDEEMVKIDNVRKEKRFIDPEIAPNWD